MSKTASAADSQSSQYQKTDLLHALNAAAGSLQRSARSREAVFRAFEEQTAALGWDGSIMLLDETGQHLTLTALAYPSYELLSFSQLEKLFNKKIIGFTFPIGSSTLYYQVISSQRPCFLSSNTDVIRQVLPKYGRFVIEQLISLVGNRPAIFAPIISGKVVQGVVNIAGPHLTADDIATVEAFANHIAIALENADLISALKRREKILEAIAFAAGQFLRLPTWEDGIHEVLSLLGQAADVSRVYLFRNHLGEAGEILTSQLFEWTAPGIPSQLDAPELQGIDYAANGFGRWQQELSAGRNIHGLVESFPEAEQNILTPQGILSILAVPIFSQQDWWGFIGFDECNLRRDWEPSEIDALQAAAGTIGAAIERQRTNQKERQQRQEAEMLMNVTTALTSTLNLDQVLDNILLHLHQVVPFVSACIFLIRDTTVQAVAGYHLPDNNAYIGQIFPVGNDVFIAQMRQTRQPVILEDAQKDANFHTWGNTGYIRGWMGVPLLVREKVIGYVTLDSDKVGAYGEKETRLAQAFVNQAAVAIENAQLFAETQRLLAQTREQTQQLQQIMNIVPDGILLLDGRQRIVSVNQAGELYLNTLGEIGEDGRLTRIGRHTLEELYQPIPTPPPWKELSSGDGKLLCEAAVWPLDRSREKDHWVLVIQDVTEERAKRGHRMAQERLAIVGQMAAGIAHDFNNIMAVIVLYTQMLLQMPNLPPKEEKRLLTIFQQSRRASELIHQILDFSRQSILERRPLSLQPFLKELTHLLQRTLPENIRIILEYDEGQFLINGDPTRIQQVVMNLALNAQDAMPNGGTLKLSLREVMLTNEQEPPLPDMAPGTWLQLQVCDNGKGIAAENLSHIFEPFFTTKSVGQGPGLGLAQVYGIVRQHEGFIDVQSAVNQGTTFSIYLPAFVPEKESVPDSKPKLPRSGKRETILIVEDDENARMAIVEILEMLNYKTLAAANGADALVLFKNHYSQIDLVLSDMVMPVMDGAALHLALSKLQPDVKMVMMTGYPLEQSGKTFLKQNVVAWMQKPLHTEQIAKTVYQALNETHD